MRIMGLLKELYHRANAKRPRAQKATGLATVEPLEGRQLFSTYSFEVPTGAAHIITLKPDATAGVDVYVTDLNPSVPAASGITDSTLEIDGNDTSSTVQDELPASVKAFTSITTNGGISVLEVHNVPGDHSVAVNEPTADDPSISVSDGTYTGADTFEIPGPEIKLIGPSTGGDTFTVTSVSNVIIDTGSATHDLIQLHGTGADVITTGAGNDTVELLGDVDDPTSATVNFGNNLGSTNLLSVSGASAQAEMAVAQQIDTVTLAGDATATFDQTSGTTTVGAFTSTSGGGNVDVTASADVVVASSANINRLNLNGTMELEPAATTLWSHNDTTKATVINQIGMLDLHNGSSTITGTLDVAGQQLLLTDTPEAYVEAYLKSGYHSDNPGTDPGDWMGPGITSVAYAQADPSLYGVGYFTYQDQVDDSGTLDPGITLSTDQILVRPTVNGDATFDGVVDVSDFGQWNEHIFTGNHWEQGDFNFDGTPDLSDYAIMKNNVFDTFP